MFDENSRNIIEGIYFGLLVFGRDLSRFSEFITSIYVCILPGILECVSGDPTSVDSLRKMKLHEDYAVIDVGFRHLQIIKIRIKLSVQATTYHIQQRIIHRKHSRSTTI